ncbi:glycoside hydrolase family 2 protein [Anaerocolumna sp. AGMB13025]|uniref:beta-mannosidase n=1 Tax=Anaerocolumna sp. AGMB13025 TaxID=3039116 RepID=UPI00241D9AA9|nr:glycoside hydrolase family 2 protein [Anaerocolumna sp. AGMB13025]WFR58359.1 glycoside hydrolase family 2 protein [Anaerocolumna sp. AGMB13025]
MWQKKLNDNWNMRKLGDKDYYEAVVPGTVYTDLLRNQVMEDPFWKDNEDKALEFMEDDYEYVTEFSCEKEFLESDRVVLHFDGLDTLTDISLNGTVLGSTDNMHRIWEFEVKELLMEVNNSLKIVFHSPTRYIRDEYAKRPTIGAEDAMEGFVHIRKAHCMFGWDWGIRLPDAGIFRPVSLLGINKARIEDLYITQEHEKNKVTLKFQVTTEAVSEMGQDTGYTVEITSPLGETAVYEGSPEKIEINNPKLWWPNGYGPQDLYRVKVILKSGAEVLDEQEKRIGLRTMTMHLQKDEWGESFAHEVNGVSIFAMGADYIPEDNLLGRVTPETSRSLLEKAKFANFNAIRVWGGGYYPEDWFYDICDELGLVVWQDFMFACGAYDLTPEFEANIRQEFIDNIKRLRHHASLGLWCGNNEMEMFAAVGVFIKTKREVRDYLFMYERILPEILLKYDPQTFYWPASPSSGGSFDEPNSPDRGDVHYWDVWHGNKPFSEYRKFFFRYASEFGFQSFPTFKTVETFTDNTEDFNIFSYVMEKHQRNGSANGKIMNYLQQIYRYPTDFKTVLYASQLLQADAIRYGVEHFRRNRGRCMGAIYWQLNDCWPVASWSSVDYTGRLKALHYAAKRFFAPVMLSCEEEGLMTSGKGINHEHFDFEKSIRLSAANETLMEKNVTIIWTLRNAKAQILRKEEQSIKVPALTSVWLDKVELPDTDIYKEYVSYELRMDGEVISGGSVLFSYPKYFKFEDPKLTYRLEGDYIIVSAGAYAKSVEILNEEEDIILSDNYFDMDAGEKKVKILSGTPVGIKLRSVFDIR